MSTQSVQEILRRLTGTAILTVALIGGVAGPAQAASVPPEGKAASHRLTASAQNADVAIAGCSVRVVRGGFTGYAQCNTNILNVPDSVNIEETFVVGTDARLYHIWRNVGDAQWSGWQLVPGGGLARDGIWLQGDGSPFVLQVVGTDDQTYCNARGVNWSGWYRC